MRALAAIAWLAAAPTSADMGRVRLESRDGCGDSAALERRIASLVTNVDVDVDARITRDGEAWRVELAVTRDGTGSNRTFAAESCEAALDAAALVAALAIDPTMQVELEGQPPAPGPVEPPHPEPRSTRPRPRWALTGGGGVAGGITPGVAGVAELRVAAGQRFWEAGGLARYVSPGTIDVEPSVGARLDLWSIGATACGVPRPKRGLALPLCATLHAGIMHGRAIGDGLTVRRGRSAWVALGLGPHVRWLSRSRIGAFVGVEALAVVLRPSFVIETVGRVCCAIPVAAIAVAGVAIGN